MFMGGGVEENLGFKPLYDGTQLGGVADVADDRMDEMALTHAAKFLGDFINGVFAVPQHHNSLGLQRKKLAAKFASDGPARARDHHHFAADIITFIIQREANG